MEEPGAHASPPRAMDMRSVLAESGELGRAMLGCDWAATPLGPLGTWPQALEIVVKAMLASRFAMWLAWGPDRTFLCNESCRRAMLGSKYPWALGKPARDVWAEIWSDIGPRIDKVFRTGVASRDESLMLMLERSGYKEETYHSLSCSPLADDVGHVAGMLCVVSDDTDRVVGERQLTVLRELAAALATVQTEPEVYDVVARQLGSDLHLLPFGVVYVLEPGGASARLACCAGTEAGQPVAPTSVVADDPRAPWPLAQVRGGLVTVEDLASRFAVVPRGAGQEPPSSALIVPLTTRSDTAPVGHLVAGLNPHRRLDAAYEGFVSLLASQISASIASARAHDAERTRAEEHTPRFEPVDLAALTSAVTEMFRPATERAGLALDVDCAVGERLLLVDGDMWATIVSNLVANAVKFTFAGSITVRLRLSEPAGTSEPAVVPEPAGASEPSRRPTGSDDGVRVTLEVHDTGIGMAPSEQAHLFERLRRVDGADARSGEGSGVGLALVAELAGLHGGRLSVESAPGAGSTFVVDIACRIDGVASQSADRTGAAASRLGPEVANGTDRPRVLVVDDNADMRDCITGLLARDYVVDVAADGRAALDVVSRNVPDLVLTDVAMPHMDGYQLLASLRAHPEASRVPVVILSARADADAAITALEAGADDYLSTPFSARELLARVRSSIELERVRREAGRDRGLLTELQVSRELLDQAQQLARLGSWELDLDTGSVHGSGELFRMLELSPEEVRTSGLDTLLDRFVHPDDVDRVRAALEAGRSGGATVVECRVVTRDGTERVCDIRGSLLTDESGRPTHLRGSIQDVTEQKATQRALAAAALAQETARQEHRIAEELQRSLLPERSFTSDLLEVSAYYQPGVSGTDVGGDWYDVIDLGAGRTALVIGDVMGRGVRAAAVMGQLRAAVRAYARLDLAPSDVLELMDATVRDLDGEQIVTCLYAVCDPAEQVLVYANAGHPPPLLVSRDGEVHRLDGALGSPLGDASARLQEERVRVGWGTTVVLYTDGLVERRDSDLDSGIDALARHLVEQLPGIDGLAEQIAAAMCPSGADDDMAVLVAKLPDHVGMTAQMTLAVPSDEAGAATARQAVAEALGAWRIAPEAADDTVLLASELVTNALVHGRPPVVLGLRLTADEVVLEVTDGASFVPRTRRATPDDEHGRGLQIVSALADRWGTRVTGTGKSVWCVKRIDSPGAGEFDPTGSG
jgi:PAS domain S-box-containing protein